MATISLASRPLAAAGRCPPVPLTPLEQAMEAEMAYYRQLPLLALTTRDEKAWQQQQALYELPRPGQPEWAGSYHARARFLLERHGCCLHRHMARQLSAEAWRGWFAQGGLLAPF